MAEPRINYYNGSTWSYNVGIIPQSPKRQTEEVAAGFSHAVRMGFGDITHDEIIQLEWDVTVPTNTNLTFWAKVSTESGYDEIKVHSDVTSDLLVQSGEIGWTEYTVSVPAGSTLVQIEYYKDGSASGGEDAVWVTGLSGLITEDFSTDNGTFENWVYVPPVYILNHRDFVDEYSKYWASTGMSPLMMGDWAEIDERRFFNNYTFYDRSKLNPNHGKTLNLVPMFVADVDTELRIQNSYIGNVTKPGAYDSLGDYVKVIGLGNNKAVMVIVPEESPLHSSQSFINYRTVWAAGVTYDPLNRTLTQTPWAQVASVGTNNFIQHLTGVKIDGSTVAVSFLESAPSGFTDPPNGTPASAGLRCAFIEWENTASHATAPAFATSAALGVSGLDGLSTSNINANFRHNLDIVDGYLMGVCTTRATGGNALSFAYLISPASPPTVPTLADSVQISDTPADTEDFYPVFGPTSATTAATFKFSYTSQYEIFYKTLSVSGGSLVVSAGSTFSPDGYDQDFILWRGSVFPSTDGNAYLLYAMWRNDYNYQDIYAVELNPSGATISPVGTTAPLNTESEELPNAGSCTCLQYKAVTFDLNGTTNAITEIGVWNYMGSSVVLSPEPEPTPETLFTPSGYASFLGEKWHASNTNEFIRIGKAAQMGSTGRFVGRYDSHVFYSAELPVYIAPFSIFTIAEDGSITEDLRFEAGSLPGYRTQNDEIDIVALNDTDILMIMRPQDDPPASYSVGTYKRSLWVCPFTYDPIGNSVTQGTWVQMYNPASSNSLVSFRPMLFDECAGFWIYERLGISPAGDANEVGYRFATLTWDGNLANNPVISVSDNHVPATYGGWTINAGVTDWAEVDNVGDRAVLRVGNGILYTSQIVSPYTAPTPSDVPFDEGIAADLSGDYIGRISDDAFITTDHYEAYMTFIRVYKFIAGVPTLVDRMRLKTGITEEYNDYAYYTDHPILIDGRIFILCKVYDAAFEKVTAVPVELFWDGNTLTRGAKFEDIAPQDPASIPSTDSEIMEQRPDVLTVGGREYLVLLNSYRRTSSPSVEDGSYETFYIYSEPLPGPDGTWTADSFTVTRIKAWEDNVTFR